MAAIILAGLFAGGAVLTTNPTGLLAGEEHEHTGEGAHAKDEDGHEDDDGHGKEKHAEPKASPDSVKLSADRLEAAGIAVHAASPADIRTAIQFPGEIRFNEDRTAHVVPRVAGVVESVPVSLGEQVRKGQRLAVIASTSLSEYRSELLAAQQRLSLATATHNREKQLWQDRISAQQDYQVARAAMQEARIAVQNASQKLAALGATDTSPGGMNRFEIRAPFDGTIVEKHLSLGEAVKEDANVFTISDLSSVWAEFAVSAKDISSVRAGEHATVSSTAFAGKAEGKVTYVGSLIGEQTRTAKARVTLTNPESAWRPGLFVTVAVAIGQTRASTAVDADAVQTLDNRTVIFLEVPGGFVARPVTLGRSDGEKVEVTDGLKPGERYAASNSFVLKSELGKASAEHKH